MLKVRIFNTFDAWLSKFTCYVLLDSELAELKFTSDFEILELYFPMWYFDFLNKKLTYKLC